GQAEDFVKIPEEVAEENTTDLLRDLGLPDEAPPPEPAPVAPTPTPPIFTADFKPAPPPLEIESNPATPPQPLEIAVATPTPTPEPTPAPVIIAELPSPTPTPTAIPEIKQEIAPATPPPVIIAELPSPTPAPTETPAPPKEVAVATPSPTPRPPSAIATVEAKDKEPTPQPTPVVAAATPQPSATPAEAVRVAKAIPVEPANPPTIPSNPSQRYQVAALTPPTTQAMEYLKTIAASDAALAENMAKFNRAECYIRWLGEAAKPFEPEIKKNPESEESKKIEELMQLALDEIVALKTRRDELKTARLKELESRQAARDALENEIQTTRRDELTRLTGIGA
ncbi:MAG: hypothetical protein ACKOLA_13390, partial [Spartobacteria bacterium]